MESTDQVWTRLLEYDGRNVQPLRSLAQQYDPSESNVLQFLELAEQDQEIEPGATWVVKHLAEQRKHPLPEKVSAGLVRLLSTVQESQSRLHLLQTLPRCALSSDSLDFLKDFLPELLTTEQHGFTRAWAFNGLAEIARHDPSYRETATGVLTAAYASERAAVRARIRNALDSL